MSNIIIFYQSYFISLLGHGHGHGHLLTKINLFLEALCHHSTHDKNEKETRLPKMKLTSVINISNMAVPKQTYKITLIGNTNV